MKSCLKIKILLLGLVFTTMSMANTISVINNTNTNIHIEYYLCKDGDCTPGTAGESFFTNEGPVFNLKLEKNINNVRIDYVEEIDFVHGDPIPNGAITHFTNCVAYLGQKITLFPGLSPRTQGSFICVVS